MSKLRDLPENTTPANEDLLYIVDESVGPNSSRKIKFSTLKAEVALTAAEVKTLYESNPDTNAFTDAEKTKLAGVEAGATADQSAAEVPYDNSNSNIVATNVQDALDEVSEAANGGFDISVASGRIVNYTAGKVRFENSFYDILAGSLILNASVTDGIVYVDTDGTIKQTSSSQNPPPLSYAIAKFTTDITSILSLQDVRVRLNQQVVFGENADIQALGADSSSVGGTSKKFADANHTHDLVTGSAIGLAPSSTNTEGLGNALARAAHTHAIATALTGDITTIQPDDTAAAGTADNFARGDHRHAIAAAAPTTALAPSTTNAEGAGTSFSRNDHQHAVSTAIAGDLSTINAGDTANAGTADNFARGDHQHPVATATAVSLDAASTNAEGNSISLARANHTHAIGTALVGDITTIQPDDAASAGVSNNFARGDHRHAIVAAAPVSTGTANSEGVSISFARADHVHNTVISNTEASSIVDDTTTSLTDVLIVGMTLTPAAGTYLVMFSTSTVNSGNGAGRNYFSIYSGGSQVSGTERTVGIAGGAYSTVATQAIVTVNGAQAIEARWRVIAGTGTVRSRKLILVRLG